MYKIINSSTKFNSLKSPYSLLHLHDAIINWLFVSLDANSEMDTSIFADVPGPEEMPNKPEGSDDDVEIFFEVSEQPMLPSFNLRLEGHDK